MVKFIGKRLAYAVLTLFLITTATFFLVAGAPGDPIAAKVGQMPEQAQQIIREKYGLDQPVVKRYTTYMKNLLTTGDFGESIIYTGQSANDIIKNNTLVSAKIGLLGLLFQTTIGICLGMVAALNRGKPVDHVIRVLVVLAICVPSFVFASVLQYFLAFKWKLVPVFGWGQMKHYILPVAAYAIGGIASYTKYMRNLLEVFMNKKEFYNEIFNDKHEFKIWKKLDNGCYIATMNYSDRSAYVLMSL